MSDRARLEAELRRMDGRPYPAYRDLRGRWVLDDAELSIDHVQGDPFAAPSRLRAWVPTGIRAEICTDPIRRLAAEDWLLRRFGERLVSARRGSGRSGVLSIYRPGPEITRRSALRLHSDGRAELRFSAGLPARGRRILGHQARMLLMDDIPGALSSLREQGDSSSLFAHIESVCVQQALRAQLRTHGLVAFVANGAVLPRVSGVSQEPLSGATVFQSPPSLEVELEAPGGAIRGMGIGEGVSLICGGGFHGKSTLLQAIQRGHLDHVPGDGRSRVVSDPDTVKIRAEDGRSVESVDISAFLGELPGGRSTRPFSTDDASGSTSQAAALVEAVESGARLLLLDEDTSATNLLVRDARMRQLVPDTSEPITPLVQRIRQLYRERKVSCILVVGGVGDYLDVADRVILMEHWHARDGTERAQQLAQAPVEARTPLSLGDRRLHRSSMVPTGKGRVRARDGQRMDYGDEEVDLSGVEQILDGAHCSTLGHAMRTLSEAMHSEGASMASLLDGLEAILRQEGLDALSPFREPVGSLVWPRRHEVAGALSRLRTLRASSTGPSQ